MIKYFVFCFLFCLLFEFSLSLFDNICRTILLETKRNKNFSNPQRTIPEIHCPEPELFRVLRISVYTVLTIFYEFIFSEFYARIFTALFTCTIAFLSYRLVKSKPFNILIRIILLPLNSIILTIVKATNKVNRDKTS